MKSSCCYRCLSGLRPLLESRQLYGESSRTTSSSGPNRGGYTALVPALPGCVTYGRTIDEAREMARDAISGYIASLRKHKDPIPTDDATLVASLDLEYSR